MISWRTHDHHLLGHHDAVAVHLAHVLGELDAELDEGQLLMLGD
jgi:hypothetical protein